jgi:hypothetical protein
MVLSSILRSAIVVLFVAAAAPSPASAADACPPTGPCTLQPTRAGNCKAGSSTDTGLLHLQLKFGAPKAQACAVVDTGSTGIVLSAKYLVGANVVRASRQPPTPSYSSSGNTYSGFWATASNLTISDTQGGSRTIPQIDLFCATNSSANAAAGRCACDAASATPCPGVAMMGVGFGAVPYYTPDYNAFLQIASAAAASSPGTCTGYAVENGARQIRIGLSANEPGYAMAKLPPASGAAAPGTCTPPSGWSWDWDRPPATATASTENANFTQQTKLLIDSGIVYMILSNRETRPAGFQPKPATQFVPGVNVRVTLPGGSGTALDYAFTTVSGKASPPAPSYVRWGTPGAAYTGIINTGNQILVGWDYLYDYSRGLNGFRKRGG